MSKQLQRYATRKFHSLLNATNFKHKIGSNFDIKHEEQTNLYSIRFKINTSIPKSLTYHLTK